MKKIAAVLFLMVWTDAAAGGVITMAPPQAFGLGLSGFNVTSNFSFSENNDDPDPLIFSGNLQHYRIQFGSVDVAEVQFSVSNSGGITDYDVIGIVTNGTGTPWVGVLMELGFGLGSEFVRSELDELSFDTDELGGSVEQMPSISSIFFGDIEHENNRVLLATGGGAVFPGVASDTIIFSFDVPDTQLIPASALTSDGYSFTLRYTPLLTIPADPSAVPEPATIVSLVLGLGSIARRRRSSVAA